MKAAVVNIRNEISREDYEAGKGPEIYNIAIESGAKIELPSSFSSVVRPDLIRKAVRSARANRRQPYGSRPHVGKRDPMPGMRHSVEWWGKGRGVSRIMRISGMRRGAQNPHTVGGRRAHGPKVEKDWSVKMNARERRLARSSALAATLDADVVSARGHRLDDDVEQLPIILGEYSEVVGGNEVHYENFDSFPLGKATRKIRAIFESIGLGADLNRARDGRHQRAGRGKMRGRRIRQPKSILVVVARKEGLEKAARNLPGVDVVAASELSTEDLAPGGDIGRLTVFTRAGLEALR